MIGNTSLSIIPKTFFLICIFSKKGPNVWKGDQKGTIFGQKSPKGTFTLLGDLIVCTAYLSYDQTVPMFSYALYNMLKHLSCPLWLFQTVVTNSILQISV